MGTTPEPGNAVCSTCHEALSEDGDCLACLLRGGMEGTMEETPPPAPVFGDFEITRRPDGSLWELGRGAMGVTYRALDRVLHRQVALKVIQTAGGNDAGNGAKAVRERFLREARAAASLRHTNVADIFQFGVAAEAGSYFYAMELVEGETLEARVRREGPLEVGTALEIASQVAAALVAAAARGLIHRDLKPSNLMLTTGELEVKVVDFGLAKIAAASPSEMDLTRGGFVGTPAFASPEQFGQGTIDARSDLYSLGVTLWYMLTGRAPFAGRTLDELRDHPAREALPTEQLTSRRVPGSVIELLRAMLAIDPAERPASARELLEALEACRWQLGVARHGIHYPPPVEPVPVRGGSPVPVRWVVASIGALVLLAAVLGAWWRLERPVGRTPQVGLSAAGEKSIAVLPFANFGEADKGYFTDGIQDEILTDLAKVADLKVISRTSVMAYVPSHTGNPQEIGRALGVAHLLEGRVQLADGKVRVNVTLIDASRDGRVEWSEPFDADLANVFQIQTEIAERIVSSLRARLSSAEKAAIDTWPTANVGAYDFYLQAKQLVVTYPQTDHWRTTLLDAAALLEEATKRDPNFALAYCLAATVDSELHHGGLEPSPARLALQKQAAATALRLQPSLGEAHLAWALYLYRGERNYAAARQELAIARAALPNNAEVFQLLSYIDRREGHWQDALLNQERASSLDPSNDFILNEQLVLYDVTRHYREEITLADACAARLPASADYYRLIKAQAWQSGGQTATARAVIAELPVTYNPNGATTYTRVCLALFDQRPADAAAILAAFQGEEYPGFDGQMTPRTWLEALIARAGGDGERAQRAILDTRAVVAVNVHQHPADAAALALLGLVDAGLGHKDDALREGKRAAEMVPISTDAMDGPALLGNLALVCAWTGEPEEAMKDLLLLHDKPGGPDFGQLKYDPVWSTVRGRDDFQAMLARMDPKLHP